MPLRRSLTVTWYVLSAAAGAVLLASSLASAQSTGANPQAPVPLLPKTLQPDQNTAPKGTTDPGAVNPPATPAEPSESFEAWLIKFKRDAKAAGISDALLERAFKDVTFNEAVIELDNRQPEFTTPIWEYIEKRTKPDAIARGRAQLLLNRKILGEIQVKYGVPREILVAIWRIESNYGRNLGSFRVVEALATLAYKGRRRPFWRSQLIAALHIVERGHAPLEKLVGSWAGAMGHTQFIPQTYLRWAVDHDGDGKRDLWSNMKDVFASTANYLQTSGWVAGQPWGLEVRLPKTFNWELADSKVRKPVADWRALGVRRADGKPLPEIGSEGSILLPAGHQGPAFLVLGNYRAILRYNNSTSYALTVALMADRLRGGGRVAAPWPLQNTPLSRTDKEEMQRLLIAEGFDVGEVDGKVGPMTRSAIRMFQKKIKQPADGFASLALLKVLRARQPAKTE